MVLNRTKTTLSAWRRGYTVSLCGSKLLYYINWCDWAYSNQYVISLAYECDEVCACNIVVHL